MYEVLKHFESEGDLHHFIRTTKKFGKRFYNVLRHIDIRDQDVKYHSLKITAIAISRDLTYIFRMNIPCSEPREDEDLKYEKFTRPKYGWYPAQAEMTSLYYPFATGDNYHDVFNNNGFRHVNEIHSDGRDLVH